jgi:hypothetical protein
MIIQENTLRQINGLLNTTPQPYRIWSDGWIEAGGLTWDFPLTRLSRPQIEALNIVTVKVGQLIFGQSLGSADDYNRQLKETFLKESSHLDEETRQFGYESFVDLNGLSRLYQGREQVFAQIRELVSSASVTAYKSELEWQDFSSTLFGRVVVAPVSTQFDILRTECTTGNNHPRTTERIIAELESFQRTYGIDITGASETALEFNWKRVPKGSAALEAGKRLFELAPDIHEIPDSFPEGRVALWWD